MAVPNPAPGPLHPGQLVAPLVFATAGTMLPHDVNHRRRSSPQQPSLCKRSRPSEAATVPSAGLDEGRVRDTWIRRWTRHQTGQAVRTGPKGSRATGIRPFLRAFG